MVKRLLGWPGADVSTVSRALARVDQEKLEKIRHCAVAWFWSGWCGRVFSIDSGFDALCFDPGAWREGTAVDLTARKKERAVIILFCTIAQTGQCLMFITDRARAWFQRSQGICAAMYRASSWGFPYVTIEVRMDGAFFRTKWWVADGMGIEFTLSSFWAIVELRGWSSKRQRGRHKMRPGRILSVRGNQEWSTRYRFLFHPATVKESIESRSSWICFIPRRMGINTRWLWRIRWSAWERF